MTTTTFTISPSDGPVSDRISIYRYIDRVSIERAADHAARLFHDGETGQLFVSCHDGPSAYVYRETPDADVVIEIDREVMT